MVRIGRAVTIIYTVATVPDIIVLIVKWFLIVIELLFPGLNIFKMKEDSIMNHFQELAFDCLKFTLAIINLSIKYFIGTFFSEISLFFVDWADKDTWEKTDQP